MPTDTKEEPAACVVEMAPGAGDDLALPLLKTPLERTKRQQLAIGTSVISILSLFVLGIALAFYFVETRLSPAARIAALVILGSEILVALFCLERIAHSDPGVVERTPQTTRPLPPVVAAGAGLTPFVPRPRHNSLFHSQVAEHLRAGRSLGGLGHVADAERGVFCTTCCIWRPRDRGRCAHCHICQRCVVGFDHHCGFYGRCITKRNMPLPRCAGFVSPRNLRGRGAAATRRIAALQPRRHRDPSPKKASRVDTGISL